MGNQTLQHSRSAKSQNHSPAPSFDQEYTTSTFKDDPSSSRHCLLHTTQNKDLKALNKQKYKRTPRPLLLRRKTEASFGFQKKSSPPLLHNFSKVMSIPNLNKHLQRTKETLEPTQNELSSLSDIPCSSEGEAIEFFGGDEEEQHKKMKLPYESFGQTANMRRRGSLSPVHFEQQGIARMVSEEIVRYFVKIKQITDIDKHLQQAAIIVFDDIGEIELINTKARSLFKFGKFCTLCFKYSPQETIGDLEEETSTQFQQFYQESPEKTPIFSSCSPNSPSAKVTATFVVEKYLDELFSLEMGQESCHDKNIRSLFVDDFINLMTSVIEEFIQTRDMSLLHCRRKTTAMTYYLCNQENNTENPTISISSPQPFPPMSRKSKSMPYLDSKKQISLGGAQLILVEVELHSFERFGKNHFILFVYERGISLNYPS